MAQQVIENMDDNLYRAARVSGAVIPDEINFRSRTLGNRNNALHIAAQYGNLGFITEALNQLNQDYYLHLCQQNFNGETPLHLAVQFGHLDTVNALLNAHNFNVDLDSRIICWMVRDYRGDTPLHKALIHGHDLIATTLFAFSLQEGTHIAMISISNDRGKTAVHYAVEENTHLMVEEFLMADSSLACTRDIEGLTPSHIAFKKGLFSMVEMILEMSPQSVEIRDNHGRTPLHCAKMDGVFLEECRTSIDERILHLLINMVDDDGNTALHVALINSEQDVAHQLLLFNGCNWRLRNRDGNIPWDLCKSNKKISHTSAVYLALRRYWAPQNSCLSNMFLEDEREVENWLDKIAVAAALLLPLNFAAAFSVPGGYDNITGKPILRNQHTFHTYSIANMVAFFAAVTILINCTFGIGKRVSKRRLALVNIFLLQVALFSTIIAYWAGLLSIGDIGLNYKARLPTNLLSAVGIVILVLVVTSVLLLNSALVVNWFI